MRPRILATVALLSFTLALAGCKGFWDAPSSSGSGGTGTTTLTSGVFWVINAETQQLISYYVNAGTLTTIASYSVPSTPIALTVAPNNEFLYVSTIGGIYVYTIASTGKLTLGNSSAPISSDPAQTMQVDATNSWLIEAISGAADAFAIPIDSSTGVPTSNTEQTRVLAGSTIQQLTISPDNSYVFVAMGASGTAAIPFTPGNTNPFGTVQTIALANTSGSALSVAVDPTDRLLYIGETAATSGSNSGGLRVFTFSNLKEITGSPFATQGLAPYAILPEAAGTYVYVANRQISGSTSGRIAGYTLSSSSGTYSLSALSSTFSAGTHTVGLAEDSTDAFVFAVNIDGSPDLNGYVFDTTTAGNLTKVIASTTGTDPVQATAVAAAH
ncbi:MAG TPA: beta-propeller fold lactonase family protein [Terracidiphilus sp.]|jgi:6-phosphogluconolactonase (cycloisomerase 2 family)|nr:beta-propeller fold lactonase family protein [Terracidiphilus sp.]